MAYSSSLLLESQQLQLGDDDFDFPMAPADEAAAQMDDDEQPVAEIKQSALAKHLNPALGAAAELLPHLRWLCACCGIPTAASAEDAAAAGGVAAAAASASGVNTPGDANSAVTAIANLEQHALADHAGHSVAPLLTLLLKGERTSSAAAVPSSAFSLTPSASPDSSQSSSSSSDSATAVSVPGILAILRALVASNRLDPVRSALLGLMLQVSQKYAGALRPHLSALIQSCLFVVRAEKLGRIKEKGMELLGFLLMLVHTYRMDISAQAEYTPPRDIISQLFREINVSKSKLSQTMRGNLLSTLGLLSELFEDEFRRQPDSVRELADFYGRTLSEELESGKPPTAKVIEGCLIGLKHFLMHFSESYKRNHQQKVLRMEGIYKAVRTAIGMQDADVKKYDILRAGLACFSRHAPLFREFIIPSAATPAVKPEAGAAAAPTETEALLSLLLQASKHGNITVSSRANFALEAFLQQVAAWLVETPEMNVKAQPHMPSSGAGAAAAAASASPAAVGISSTKRRLFNLLLSVFVKKLDASKSVSEVSLAVRAVGQLAKVVVLYLNEGELRKIMAKLLEQSEKLFRAQTLDEVDRAVSHMPDFLSAFAFILKELGEVDSTVLDSIVSMVRRFFLAYPTFTSSQRSKNMVSLTRLYVVLYTKGILFQNLLDKTLLSALVLSISKLPQLTDMQFFRQGKPLLSERQAYVEYSYLFHNLLGVSVRQDDKGDKSILGWNKGLEIPEGETVVWQMRKALFDQIMGSAIKLLKTLDLSLVGIQTQEARDEQASSAAAAAAASAAPISHAPTPSSSDPSSSFAPANPKDYELFHNLIEFLQRFFFPPYAGSGETAAQVGAASSATAAPEEKLTLNHHVGKKSSLRELVMPSLVSGSLQSASSFLPKWALQWIAILVPELIALSNKNPLVSGYYKLLSLLSRIMEQFSYLSDIDLRPSRIKLEEEEYDGVRVKHEGASPVVKMEDEGDEKHDAASSAAAASSSSTEVSVLSARKVPLDTVANRRFVFNLLSDFLDSVLVRIGQFTDELLYAAIHLVLSAPLQFVRLDAWVPALIKAIDIGKNYRPAAYLSVQVLNKLHDVAGGSYSNNDEVEAAAAQTNIRITSAELAHFLPEILPHLYDYLRVPKADSATVAASVDLKKATTATQRSNAAEQVELELVSRILQFLGRVGGQNRFLLGKQAALEGDNSGMAGSASDPSVVAVRWSPTSAIKFSLPLSMSLPVTLDALLPHLTQLAEFSTERKVQVAACEALHALIIFMICSTARDPNRSNDGKSADESAYLAIYQNLFPIMLRLATSVEIVTKQLFHPLLFQIIHWFSNTNTTLPKDTRALLDAVVDAVGNEGNGALREHAAEAMSEFLQWAMKHGSPANKGTGRSTRAGEEEEKASSAAAALAGGSAINTKALLRRLFTLALHPSPAKRLGAALTFNKLYKIFREYDSLIAHHTLDILEHMLRSLRLAEHDDEALGTLDEARAAIANLERIVTDADARKFNLLLKPTKPECAGGAFCQSLPLFCTHLLETAGSLEDNVRRESLRLFQSFCKVLPKSANGQDAGMSFLRDYINDAQSLKQFIAIIERGEGAADAVNTGEASSSSSSAAAPSDSRASEIVAPPWTVDAVNSMTELDESSSGISDVARWQSLQTWLTRLSSALDVYWWLLREKLVSASVSEASDRLFAEEGASDLKPSLKNFLLLMSYTSGATNRVDAWVTTYADTASATTAAATALKEKYASLKCTVLIRLFRFMQLQLSDEAGAGSAFRSLLGNAFYSLIFRAVLLPETMGFQSSHTKRIQLLQQTIGQLCSTLSKLSNKRHIIDALSTLLQEPQVAPASFQLSLMLNRVGFSAMVMEGYRQLWTSGLLPLALGAEQCSEFAHTLLQNAFQLHTRISGSEADRKVQLSPLGRNMANQMLQLAFHVGVSPDRLFACLTDQSPVELPSRGSRQPAAAAATTVIRVKLEQDLDALTTQADSAVVPAAALSSDSRKGGVFYTQFRSLIDSYLAYRFPIFSAHILSRAFTSKDMFGLLLNIADYVIQRRQRKVAVEGAFSASLTLTTPQGVAPADGGAFSSVLAEVQSQAASYVQHITEGFSDACSAFMASRSLASGSSNASVGGAGFNPKKQSARQRTAAPVQRDASKLLQLPSDSELASMLLQLIERLLILDAPKILSADSNPSFASMLEIHMQCLSVDANLALKKKAVSILPALFLAPTSTQAASAASTPSLLVAPPGMEPLIGAVRQMLMHPPFPPRSTDLLIGSAEWVDYTSLLDLLLNALVLSKSFVLLELLLPILREGDEHTYKAAIHLKLAEYLDALVSNSLGERAGQVDEVLSKTFELFSQQDLDTSAKSNVRYWLAKYILIPLLRLCGLSSARAFFLKYIRRVFAIVSALPEGPKISASPEDQQLALMEMEVAYSLIAIMYRRLDKSEPACKEIAHKDVIKYSHQHVKHIKVSPNVSSMAFAGAAFHALSCALMATQTDPKFLNVLCFTETAAKGEELWSHLIDVNRIGLLKFEIETNFATVDATLADMQLLSRAPNAVVPDAGDEEGIASKGPRYLSSQYLSDSSVSQEAQGLFENQFQGPLHVLQQQQQAASSDAATSMVDEEEMSTSSVAMAVDSSVVEMVDLDPIMNIPAMPILLQLVEYMENKFGAAHRDNQLIGDSNKMPDWMNLMWQKFQSPSTHVTIRWCIAKLLVLKPAIFQPYASMWFISMVELMTMPPEQNGGIGFVSTQSHYFLRDLCSVFLRWRFVPGPDEPDREAASTLIAHLMRVAIDHGQASEGKRSRLRANLLTIKLLIDLWQHRLRIDRRIIHAHLMRDITKARAGSEALTARQIGLQLFAIIIEKGFPGYDPIEDRLLKEDDMLTALVSTMSSDLKTLYEPAAEVLGIWISRLAKDQRPGNDMLGGGGDETAARMLKHAEHAVRQSLKKMFFAREFTQFFNVLLKLSLYLGRQNFLNDDLLTLVFQVPQTSGEFLHKFLQLLCWSSTTTGRGIYERLKPVIKRVFLTVDSKAHELVLMILFRLAGELSLDDLRELLPDLAVLFPKHTNEACRMLFYKILIWIYDQHDAFQDKKVAFLVASSQQGRPVGSPPPASNKRGAAAASSASSSSSAAVDKNDPLVHLIVVNLLRGLSDSVVSVREHMFAFWDHQDRLSHDVQDRMLKLLTSFFHAETVELWLSYATRLLMYPMRSSSTWNTPFSPEPLEKSARFDLININASGFTRSQPMQPLFGTNSQQQNASLSMDASGGQAKADDDALQMTDIDGAAAGGAGWVLNSQAGGANFAATPSLMSMTTQELMQYNLSQSSQSEHLYYRGSGGSQQAMGSYAAFTSSPHQRAIQKRLKGKKRVSIKDSRYLKSGNDTVSLRFAGSVAGARANSLKWRTQADLKNRYEKQWAARVAEESASSVTLFRQYRKGDLPDIQLKHAELLQPLESLHTEPAVARQLFVTIFHAVYMQTQANTEQTRRFRSEMREAVRSLLHRLTPSMAAQAAPLVFALQTAILRCGTDDPKFTSGWDGRDIKQLGELSYHSKTYHSGVLLLEHVIATQTDIKTQTSKRHRDEESAERHEQAYFQLARLYRELRENEIMMNLYSQFAKQTYTRDAIAAMLRGDWQAAMTSYDDALTRFDQVTSGAAEWVDPTPSNDEIELWSDERLECLRQLTSWSALRANVLEEIDHQPDRLWDPQYTLHGDYLRHYLTSGLKVTEEVFLSISNAAAVAAASSDAAAPAADAAAEDPRGELLRFVERAFKKQTESDILQKQHAADLVLLYALNGFVDNATNFLRRTYSRFLVEWTDLPQHATGPRLALLERLQKLSEVSEFLSLESQLSSMPTPTPAAAASLVKKADPTAAQVTALLSITASMHNQLSVWRTRLPSSSDSVEGWDDIVLNRSAFLVHLKQSIEGKVGSMPAAQQRHLKHVVDAVRSDLSSATVEMYRRAANVMLKQGNTAVAGKYITASKQLLRAHGIARTAGISERDADLAAQLDFLLNYSAIKVKHAHLTATPLSFGAGMSDKAVDDAKRKFSAKTVKTLHALLSSSWESSVALKQRPSLPLKPDNLYHASTQKAALGQELGDLLLHDPTLSRHADGKTFEQLMEEAGDELDQMAITFHGLIKDPALAGPAHAVERAGVHRRAGKAFMATARFCDRRLTQCDEHRQSCDACKARGPCIHPLRLKSELESHLIESLVDNVLAAMKLGSMDAVGMFPRALEWMGSVDLKSPLRKRFMADTAIIPSWMFIQWIPQLLAVIALPEAALAFPILLRIAKEYPQAIYAPFNMTNESINPSEPGAKPADKSGVKPETVKYLRVLGSHLRLRLLGDFIQSLDYLMVPEMKLRDLVGRLNRAIQSGDNESAVKMWTNFRHRHLSSVRPAVAMQYGVVYQTFASSWYKVLDSYFGNDGRLIKKMNSTSTEPGNWRKVLEAIQKKLANEPGVSKDFGKKPLATYTLWLGQYEKFAAASGEHIELPGQYSGKVRPQPESHIRIVNFDPTILVMSSLRKPKRLTILGSDERSHNYLVKGGEDLRMDQRVEQVFCTMNEILASDTAAARRALSLRTYQVIPFSPTMGMLEWVPDTEPLKGLLLSDASLQLTMNKMSNKFNELLATLFDKYNKGKQQPPQNNYLLYFNMLKNADRATVTQHYRTIADMIAPDLVAKFISRLCGTPESFLSFRSSFARTFCSLTICAYILGLGDRHLENFLVCTTTGEIVGIDFGAAFGQGVLLSVPELMPFRYTRQLQNMLAPLQTEAVLSQDMTYVLRALRGAKSKLLTVMDVFIKEPQMEWIASAAKEKRDAAFGDDVDGAAAGMAAVSVSSSASAAPAPASSASDWYARRKIRIATMKLDGTNPARVLSLELKENKNVCHTKDLYERCVAHLMGEPGTKRAQVAVSSTAAEQVELLLDMAKDPNILGRTWVGWGPFL